MQQQAPAGVHAASLYCYAVVSAPTRLDEPSFGCSCSQLSSLEKEHALLQSKVG